MRKERKEREKKWGKLLKINEKEAKIKGKMIACGCKIYVSQEG